MKKLVVIFLIIFVAGLPALTAQEAPKPSATATAVSKKGRKAAAAKTESGGSAKAEAGGSPKPKGMDLNAGVTGPITTEIYADEAFFDSSKSVGIFRGHVKVNDPRFNLQSDKLTAFISKSSLNAQTAQAAPGGQTGVGRRGRHGKSPGEGPGRVPAPDSRPVAIPPGPCLSGG